MPASCSSSSSQSEGLSEVEANLLDDILGRDPLAEISEQEKETLWRLRRQCMSKKYANILPRYILPEEVGKIFDSFGSPY